MEPISALTVTLEAAAGEVHGAYDYARVLVERADGGDCVVGVHVQLYAGVDVQGHDASGELRAGRDGRAGDVGAAAGAEAVAYDAAHKGEGQGGGYGDGG